jgi:hypothetical protein
LSSSDGFVFIANYFSSSGRRRGSFTRGCVRESHEGFTVDCPRDTPKEPICELALKGLRRTGASVALGGRRWDFGAGEARLETKKFTATVTVDEDATKPVTLTVITPGFSASPMTLQYWREYLSELTPDAKPVSSGNPFPLPAQVNGTEVMVQSTYEMKEQPQQSLSAVQ